MVFAGMDRIVITIEMFFGDKCDIHLENPSLWPSPAHVESVTATQLCYYKSLLS